MPLEDVCGKPTFFKTGVGELEWEAVAAEWRKTHSEEAPPLADLYGYFRNKMMDSREQALAFVAERKKEKEAEVDLNSMD